MARRRRINTPSQADLDAMEEGFARETGGRGPSPALPPIAQVAGEAARLSDPEPPEARVARARDERDAAEYRAARDKGLVVQEVPMHAIEADALTRDRLALDPDEMDELMASITAHGLRFPIEVYALPRPEGDKRYGLISGYRRMVASLALAGGDASGTIKALVRPAEGLPEAFVAMVEENEIRADLSQYERGRIAVMAAAQGVYPTVEAAVNALFAAGSKAKRSKIRSFARIHEDLGDVLRFPTALGERAGLQVAGALKAGRVDALREALRAADAQTAEAEWAALSAALAPPSASPSASASSAPDISDADLAAARARLENTAVARGLRVQAQDRDGAYVIALSGPKLTEDARTAALVAVLRALRDLG